MFSKEGQAMYASIKAIVCSDAMSNSDKALRLRKLGIDITTTELADLSKGSIETLCNIIFFTYYPRSSK